MKRSRRSPRGRRFVRGAQVADISKLIAAEERRRLRRASQSRQDRMRLKRFMQTLSGGVASVLIIAFLGSRVYIASVSTDPPAYESTATAYFERQPLERLKPLMDHQALSDWLSEQHPEIAYLNITSGLFSNRLRIEAVMRSPAFIWLDERRGSSYLLDDSGVAYREISATDASESSEPTIIDASGVEVTLGRQLLGQRSIDSINEAIDGLGELAMSLKHVRISSEPQNFQIHTNERDYYLIFTTAREISDQLSDASEFLGSRQGSEVSLYVDLRVPDKIFFR